MLHVTQSVIYVCYVSYAVITGLGSDETEVLLMSSSDDMGAMNRYVTLQPLGDGTYGSVMLGQRVDTGEKVRSGAQKLYLCLLVKIRNIFIYIYSFVCWFCPYFFPCNFISYQQMECIIYFP